MFCLYVICLRLFFQITREKLVTTTTEPTEGTEKGKGSRADSKNSIDSHQNGPTKKLIRKGRARAQAQAQTRDCSRGLLLLDII